MLCSNRQPDFKDVPDFEKVKVEGALVDIKVDGMTKFSEQQKLFMFQAIDLMEVVYSSAEFMNKALHTYMSHRDGHSYLEIYKMCLGPISKYDTIEDQVIAIFVDLYDGKKSVLGYTSMSSGRMFTNRAYLNTCMMAGRPDWYAGHLAHERMHTLSFRDRWPKKRQSVPYMYGKIMRQLAERVLRGQQLTLIKNPI